MAYWGKAGAVACPEALGASRACWARWALEARWAREPVRWEPSPGPGREVRSTDRWGKFVDAGTTTAGTQHGRYDCTVVFSLLQ